MQYKIMLFILLLAIQANSQTENHNKAFSIDSGFFNTEKLLEITLKSDFKKFKKEKVAGARQDAEIICMTDDSVPVSTKVHIKARGKNRKETCSFPPVQIILQKSAAGDEKLSTGKFKMVVHCNESKSSETTVLEEYLCYRLYNCITNNSFRTRLLHVKYIDTGTKNKDEVQRYAFIIEDIDNVEKRLNAVEEKKTTLTQISVQKENILRLAMFEFMIGNFDWGVPTLRNIKLIRPMARLYEIYALPYDFDYCGLVNASYAKPAEVLNISSVRERLYLGQCKPYEEFLPVITDFKGYKEKFYQTIEQFEYLGNSEKKLMTDYLDDFYQLLDYKYFYENYILPSCKDLDKKG